MSLIKDWLDLCTNYDYLIGKLSGKYASIPTYIGNDCDSGLFNLCLAKYKVNKTIFPDECNLYNNSGMQLIHCGVLPKNTPWEKLIDMPIQIRRLTPKFGL